MPGAVTWENNRGRVSTGPPDFTYKQSSWQLGSRQGVREFSPREDVLAVTPTSLWPLRVGNAAGHSERGVWSEKDGPEKTYRNKLELQRCRNRARFGDGRRVRHLCDRVRAKIRPANLGI